MTAVRPLGGEDWATLRDLRLAALRDAPDELGATEESARLWPEQRWREWPGPRGVRLGAFRVDEPVGLVAVLPAADPATALLLALWVAPGARGTGVGDVLVAAVVAQARDWGCRSVLLEVLPANQAAIRLYHRNGFAIAADRPTVPGAVTMRRALP